MKKVLAGVWLFFLTSVICLLFWNWEYVYNLPTKIPEAYVDVPVGRPVHLPIQFNNTKPVFLHFFNPDCPCSRFNMPHVKSLIKEYGSRVNFVMVLMTDDISYTEKRVQQKYGLNIPILADTAFAAACGVYSTPQAVILNSSKQLHYRGNYNKSRYCTNKQTNYAQIALDSLLHLKPTPVFDVFASKAYGCQLPVCSKK